MIPVKKLRELAKEELDSLFNRFGGDFSDIMINTVVPIVNDVRFGGDDAVRMYTERFDGAKLDRLMVTEEEIERAFARFDKKALAAFGKAKENIEEFHLHQKRANFMYMRPDGTTLGVHYEPIESAGVYVPGGKASYPSSVLMGAIPARIAGVKNITIITPPDKTGNIPDSVLAVCKIIGVGSVLKSGGAQGIAAAGFGTESVTKADIIVGPGNIYVTAAKTYLFSMGIVQIDSMAGPSEVLIIADESADPVWVAYDFLSQAEHEERALAVLVTTSEILAQRVVAEIEKDIARGTGRIEIKRKALERAVIILVDSIDEAIEFSNRYGPEHMEFMVPEPLEYLGRIRNVGSLFLGTHAPVAVGDYYSGTNHILPTGGAARFSSGVSVETFLRRTTFQHLTPGALREALEPVMMMSRVEGFDDKHGGSVEIRFSKK
ncbi:MAG: histidinol dehydrogenase [Spirochaetes bacterium]|jgi:histidinol dehydrogenase|nr:histidinol dehydrogenase [Spirochaetota bacterium]